MVEYFFENAPPPSDQGELYDWMFIKAKSIKTNSFTLMADSGVQPTFSGLPSSRMFIARYRDNTSPPPAPLLTALPANEAKILHPIFAQPNLVTTTQFSSNGARIGHIPGLTEWVNFEFHQPPSAPSGMMNASIDFSVWTARQDAGSIPVGESIQFNVQCFQATLPDFSDEFPLALDTGSDRMFITMTTYAGDKQTCHFAIASPANATAVTQSYFVRFKISREISTVDQTSLFFDQVTLTVHAFDSV